MVRWSIALATSVTVLTAVYHFGTKRTEHWLWVGPGAVAGTLLWFPTTLAFGWYVTRVADYSMFYGSFGAGIATLVWLYITAFSVLVGAELNGVLYRDRQEQMTAQMFADPQPESRFQKPVTPALRGASGARKAAMYNRVSRSPQCLSVRRNRLRKKAEIQSKVVESFRRV